MERTEARCWRRWGQGLLDLLFPPRCVGCRRPGVWICATCLEQTGRTDGLFCTRCGQALSGPGPCRRCRVQGGILTRVGAPFLFEGVVQRAVHELKYRGRRVLAEPLGDQLAAYVQAHSWPHAAIVPVPLHPRRERDRGYNQAALLARVLSDRLQWPLLEGALVRQRDTRPQVGLDRTARLENVQGAFLWRPGQPPPRRTVLLDDVYTTGATMEACAEALRASGTEEVCGLALARPRPGGRR